MLEVLLPLPLPLPLLLLLPLPLLSLLWAELPLPPPMRPHSGCQLPPPLPLTAAGRQCISANVNAYQGQRRG